MRELWKDIEGYEGYYQVSNKGQVKSLYRVVVGKNGRPLTVRERILKPNSDRVGYLYVALNRQGKTVTKKVHRLVGETFIPNPLNLPQINHKNGRKGYNLLENLEWVTANENQSHRYHVLKKQKNVHGMPRGVNWRPDKKKWRARTKVDGNEQFIGHFDDKGLAYEAYYDTYKEIHGYDPWCLEEHPTH